MVDKLSSVCIDNCAVLFISCIGNSQNEVDSSKNILVHPNFRMIVLANRPGFPFLGNDFFASLGKNMLFKRVLSITLCIT